MNHRVGSQTSDMQDLVVMIKKSETADLMDYTNSGNILRDERLGVCGYFLIGISWMVILLTFPISLLVCFKVLDQYQRET